MKEGITEILLNWLKTQAVYTVLLCGAIVYFYFDNKEIKNDLKDCGKESKELERVIRDQLTEVINKNTFQLQIIDNTMKNYFYSAPYRPTPGETN